MRYSVEGLTEHTETVLLSCSRIGPCIEVNVAGHMSHRFAPCCGHRHGRSMRNQASLFLSPANCHRPSAGARRSSIIRDDGKMMNYYAALPVILTISDDNGRRYMVK